MTSQINAHSDALDRAAGHLQALLAALWRLQPYWLEIDLTMAQTRAFMAICSAGTVHGRRLARELEIGQPAVSKLVDHLVSKGLVTRKEDPEDRRIVWLSPTEQGKALFERLTLSKRDTVRALLQFLSPAELERVADVLALLARVAEGLPAQTPSEDSRSC